MLRLRVRKFAFFTPLAGVLLLAQTARPPQIPQNPPKSPAPSNFDRQVLPVLSKNCAFCHNDRNASGGLNLGLFATPSSLTAHRDEWERIIAKMRSGEMPPKGLPKPTEAQLAALYAHVESEFEKADRALKPDPGRVTARRLNRNEYTNTIRDLLAVDFRADKDFPTDDSGYGFDNIGDVLTISPILMEKYVRAAERIAARAIGGDPLPKKPLEAEFSGKGQPLRRLDINTIELTHRIDWDGEYKIIIGLPGERPKDSPPVELAFYMDGKKLHSQMAETKPSGLVYFNPFSAEEMKLVLPEGDHVFRVAFLNDDFPKALTEKEQRDDKKNKRIGSVTFIGPFPAQVEKASRKRLLTCDPATGKACVDKIVSSLARRAYRRPVTRAEVASLTKFVDLAKSEGLNAEQGIQLAIQAMLTSPHFLFRIERDPDPTDPTKVHRIADIELASRLSYFLWTSMPDDQLLALAEQKKLAANLDAQVKRMLDDPRSATLADNFAGQWLEIRNLDSVKPDPQKFPEWSPELRDAMKTETRLFFEAMLRENRPMADFLDAPFTYLNERLAKHYGIKGVIGPDFRKVELTTPERGGILSHASVLTVSSYPTRTSPVIRGKYVLQNIMGAPPPPPPADVPPLDEEGGELKGSLRQRMEQHRTNPVCSSCHTRMDTLGFGLENYDATGKWRLLDGKFEIDASGTLPNGKSFKTPSELRTLLRADLPAIARCVTEKMLTYSLGRGLERYDRKTINQIVKNLAANDYKFQTLVYEIVHSLPYQSRRGEALRTETAPKPKEIASR